MLCQNCQAITQADRAECCGIPVDTECQRSFDLLRNLLSSPPILVYPDFTKPFILDTDASNEGIGAVLSQLDSQGQELTIVPYNGFTEPRNRKDKLPDGWKNCSSLKSSIVRACVTPMPMLYPDCRVLSVALLRNKERKRMCCR